MPRDKIVSWRTLIIFILFPPAAILAIIFFPITLLVMFWLYYRGKRQTLEQEHEDRQSVQE